MRSLKLILPLLLFMSLQLFPQAQVSISKPILSYSNDTLVIIFDITNCNDAIFEVEPRITTSGGAVINASGLSGDTGKNVSCGSNKKIIWSLAKDDISLNEEIEVQIIAEQLMINIQQDRTVNQAGKEVKEGGDRARDEAERVEEEAKETEPGNKNILEKTGDKYKEVAEEDVDKGREKTKPSELTAPAYSRANIMASSVIFPGLGQKKASRKGAPLLLGVIGYGSLAASGYFLYDYNKKYDQYLEAMSVTESERLFEESDKAYKTARNLIYGAAGIWAINLIWSAVIPSSRTGNLNASISTNDVQGIHLYAKWTF